MAKSTAQTNSSLSATTLSARRRLRRLLLLFFVFLTVPLAFLLARVYDQLENETYFLYRKQAEDLASRIDDQLAKLLRGEEQRKSGDYQFFNVKEAPLLKQQEVAFSPLSQLPPQSNIPGIIGYFQVTPDDRLLSPVLPDLDQMSLAQLKTKFGIPTYEIGRRTAHKNKLRSVLTANRILPDEGKRGKNLATNAIPHTDYVASQLATPLRLRNKFSDMLSPSGGKGEGSFKYQQSGDKEILASIQNGKKYARSQSLDQSLKELNIDTRYWERQQKSAKRPAKQRGTLYQKQYDAKGNVRLTRKEKIVLPRQTAAHPQTDDNPISNTAQSGTAEWLLRNISPPPAEKGKEQSLSENSNRYAPTAIRGQDQSADTMIPDRGVSIVTFEGAVDPLQFAVLRDGEFTFFRRVWQERQRYIQGFLTDGNTFLDRTVRSKFQRDDLAQVSSLIVGYQADVYRQYPKIGGGSTRPSSKSGQPLLLYRTSLSPPLGDIELLFTMNCLPTASGQALIHLIAASIGVVLLVGLVLIYRLGLRHIELAQKRNDFVSAVSHELKTPLTSIRMYGEMLREGWITDKEKLQSYYDFIFFESERLSRLIANVLQLSRLSKDTLSLELKKCTPRELIDVIRSKITSQVEAAGFSLEFKTPEQTSSEAAGEDSVLLMVDQDAFSQIIINLVDNAVKFSKNAPEKKLIVGYRQNKLDKKTRVSFFVRDFGPGVDPKQAKKIFQLFYRAESEMTRATPGTGIGLALVKELCREMGAEISLVSRKPGAEFQIKFS